MANNGINSQISNIMPNVYGISEAETSSLISVAGLINIVLFVAAGKVMAARGNIPTYSLGIIMRLVGALGMALVGLVSDSPALLGVAFSRSCTRAARSPGWPNRVWPSASPPSRPASPTGG